MKLHAPIESLPTFTQQLRYKLLDDAVDDLEIGQVLPVECVDLRERKQCRDHLRYKYPDLILRMDGNFLYAEKGHFSNGNHQTAEKAAAID
jgi:hypothetical protein